MNSNPVFDEKAAAAYLNMSVKTLQGRRSKHVAPAYIKAGRSVRYLKEDLDKFLSSCRVDPEARN